MGAMADGIFEEKRLLPVLSVVGRSYSYVWDYRRLLAPPLAVVFLIEYAVAVVAQPGSGRLPVLAVALAGIVGLMTFAVGLHRAILLGDVRHGVAFLRWDRSLRHYAWAWVKIFLVTLLGAFLVGLVLAGALYWTKAIWKGAVIGAAILAAIGLVALPRSVLALPAAALGYDGSLGQAWRATRGNWLRMIAVLILATLPFWILGLLLELPVLGAAAMGKLVPSMAAALLSLKYVLVGFSAALRAIATAVLTVTLSLSYGALAMPPGFRE
jgi:hypothetical protein